MEPNWTEVVRLDLPLPRLPRSLEGLTLVQISDLHIGHLVSAAQLRRLVSMTNDLRADIAVVTGDMFNYLPEDAVACAQELAALRAPLGVFAIMGNHERRLIPEEGEAPFRNAGLTVLVNAAREISADGASLWMMGVDDLLMRRGDLEKGEALLKIMDEVYGILVTVDYPDAITRGLRRTTDMVRGVLERTRGDLTMAVRQQRLETTLKEFEGRFLDRLD